MPSSPASAPGQDLSRNPRLFLYFRVLFNARFYYPIYAILFLDFGLTIGEFAVLNFSWAVTIVVLEVPSGALAAFLRLRCRCSLNALIDKDRQL
ncbi:MAG: hypothetical protein ACC661_12120 [Verrucomicrobiales bacterium]